MLHVHVLVRVDRAEAPPSAALGMAARTATAASKVSDEIVGWGEQSDCKAFQADGDGARTIWYLSKALNYVMKDTAKAAPEGDTRAWRHLATLDGAARRMRCSSGCVPRSCSSAVHSRYGSRSHVVSASRRTKHRTGWSFTGLTRTAQRRFRAAWYMALTGQRSEIAATAHHTGAVDPVGCSSAGRAAPANRRAPPASQSLAYTRN